MTQATRRRFLATVAAASTAALVTPDLPRSHSAEPAPTAVPMLHVTDLFRPHNDPDDHWDLACAYALAYQGRADLHGVLIDFPPPRPPRDPDVMAVAQMNYLTGKCVPVLVGSPRLIAPAEADSAGARADLRGIRAMLDLLRRAPRPVVISVLGSTRDVALAGKLEPDLFATKCAGIYLNAGSGTPDKAKAARLEYNVGLDPASYAAIFQLPCPIYWMPCFEDAGDFRVAEYGTFYRFRQAEALPHLSDRVQNFFALMYKHGGGASGTPWNWLQYLLGAKEPELLTHQGTQFRNMWCTAGFLHAVGLTVARDGQIRPCGETSDAVFRFDPIKVTCAANGVTEWTNDPTSKDRFIFRVRDQEHYQAAMTAALKSLLLTLP
jgi:hypothetical protein